MTTPAISSVITPGTLKADEVLSLQAASEHTKIPRAVLKRLCESGQLPHVKTGKSHVLIGGLALWILLGLPPPAPVVPPANETKTDRRTRGQSALDSVLNPKPKKKGKP